MKHYISFESQDSYTRFVRHELNVSDSWSDVEVVEFTPEVDGAGNLYHSLTLESHETLPETLELDVCGMDGVLATNFNVEQ